MPTIAEIHVPFYQENGEIIMICLIITIMRDKLN